MKKLIVSTKDHTYFICHEQITWCRSINSYSVIETLGGDQILSSKPLHEIGEELNCDAFMKVSQSHLVNRNHISSIDKKKRKLILTTGCEVAFTIKINELINSLVL